MSRFDVVFLTCLSILQFYCRFLSVIYCCSDLVSARNAHAIIYASAKLVVTSSHDIICNFIRQVDAKLVTVNAIVLTYPGSLKESHLVSL